MKIFKLSDKYYCIADICFTYEELVDKLSGAWCLKKGSFAEFYSRRIIQACFQYARDLRKDYLSYYGHEYKDFGEYLYHKELLDWEHIDRLDLSEGQTLLKLNITLSNYNAKSLLEYGAQEIELLNRALESNGL